ncbi:MAG: toll/interleukin-1 receptor domain-containing protein [Actinomycetota bacterium]|nr:toll/interleukin-1 receptor domain-containing protein [Actinomycetota bacterium]
MRVFLSYRRSDVGGYAGRLYDALVQRLGAKNVFQDVTAITPGEDFTEAIRRAIDSCDAMLAVIGPGWAASAPEGRPRLIEPDDYVRVELATALKREVPVVPVLLGGARLPAAADLPDDLAPLAQRQGVAVRDEVWHQDVDRLLRSLRGETAVPTRRSRWRAGGAVALALAALGAVGWLQWAGGGDGEQEAATVAPCVPPGGAGWASLPIGQQATGTVNRDAGSLEYTVREARWRPLEPGRWQLSLETSMANRTPEDTYHGDWNYDSVLVGQRAFKKSCFSPTPDLVLPGAVGDALVGFDVTCEPAGYIELVLGNSAARIKVTDAPEPGSC